MEEEEVVEEGGVVEEEGVEEGVVEGEDEEVWRRKLINICFIFYCKCKLLCMYSSLSVVIY